MSLKRSSVIYLLCRCRYYRNMARGDLKSSLAYYLYIVVARAFLVILIRNYKLKGVIFPTHIRNSCHCALFDGYVMEINKARSIKQGIVCTGMRCAVIDPRLAARTYSHLSLCNGKGSVIVCNLIVCRYVCLRFIFNVELNLILFSIYYVFEYRVVGYLKRMHTAKRISTVACNYRKCLI